MPRFQIASLALLSLGLMACGTSASSEDKPTTEEALQDKRVGERVDRVCFAQSISGFREWDGPDGLILKKGVRDEYLVVLSRSCRSADRAQRVGLDDRFGSGCITRGDSLYISEEIFGGNDTDPFTVDRCLITAIYEWNEDATEE